MAPPHARSAAAVPPSSSDASARCGRVRKSKLERGTPTGVVKPAEADDWEEEEEEEEEERVSERAVAAEARLRRGTRKRPRDER